MDARSLEGIRVANVRYNRSLISLARGDFENGWREFEARRECSLRHVWRVPRDFKQPLWLGEESIAGKRLLLYGEGGLGDTLQFCRYAALAAAQATVLLEVQPPLLRILDRLAGVTELIAAGTSLPAFDYQCPLMSLPLAFKTTLGTIPAGQYLYSDPVRVECWRALLGPRSRPRVGIVWSGSANKTVHHRSVPLSEWIKYLPRDFEYFSLQTELRAADRRTLQSSSRVVSFDGSSLDFPNTAALIDCMDVVVSIDTSLAHLSGALGRPTWLLLPVAAEWRWLLEREDSPWYPSMKLYRQRSRDNWSEVFARIAVDLHQEFRPA